MPTESDLIPYQAAAVPSARAVLVLAPHPDDEVFGCGGAIAQHVDQGTPVHVLVLTDGALGGDAAVRAAESRCAARVLGCAEPTFWGLPDRALRATDALAQRLRAHIQAHAVDLVYAPSPHEVHPDHRQTTALLRQALACLDTPLRVAFYEVGVPLRPNLLLDITRWQERKQAAADCFASQLAAQDYQEQVAGLNRFRTYTLPRTVRAAEAFCLVSSHRLAADALGATAGAAAGDLSEAFTWEALNQPEGSTAAPDWPLVSVVVRSIGRELLHEALDSVARQTWPAIEVVVVAASATHPPLPVRCGPYPLRQVGGEPLRRSRAANVGLDAARGRYVLLLDDDDWLLPTHVERLARALRGQRLWRAAHAGVLCVDAANRPLGQTFDLPFDPLRQRAGNLTPIHAVLFERALCDEGCRFDEALDRYEDWDFWLQVAARTAMAHVPGVSAAYRIHASSGVHEETGPGGASTQTVVDKWQATWTPEHRAEILERVWAYEAQSAAAHQAQQALATTQEALHQHSADLASSLRDLARERDETARARLERDALQTERERLQAQCEVLGQERDRLQQEAAQRSAELDAARLLADGRRLEIEALRSSRSWRLTTPLRAAGSVLRAVRRAFSPSGRAAARQVYAAGGLPAVAARALQRLAEPLDAPMDYVHWVRSFDTPDETRLAQWHDAVARLPRRPLVSVLMPVFNPPLDCLREAVASVRAQVYPDWELCIADDASTDAAVWPTLQEMAAEDPRIKLQRRAENGHIAEASNTALALAEGEVVALMDNDDLLPPQALLRVVQVLLARPDAQIIYSDEDKIDAQGRNGAYFKSDWNHTLFLGHNMISHLGVYRTALVREVGGFRRGFEGSQDYDLALRCVERIEPGQIVHIPEVLYHWRVLPGSTALALGEKPYAVDAAVRALQEHVDRRGWCASVAALPTWNYEVVPFADREPQALTLLLIDDDADAASAAALPAHWGLAGVGEVWRVPPRAADINRRVAEAPGTHVALVHAALAPTSPGVLTRLWRHALVDDVGVAAGSVWGPDDRLRGCGLVLSPQGGAAVLHAGMSRLHGGYMGRAALTQELSAVRLEACVLRRDAFVAAGGLEADLGEGAAVSLCLRLRDGGHKTVWCPAAAWQDERPQAAPAPSGSGAGGQAAPGATAPQRWAARSDPHYHPALDAEQANFALNALGPWPWHPEALAAAGPDGPRQPANRAGEVDA